MSQRKTKIIDAVIQVEPFIQNLKAFILKALETDAVAVDVYRPEESRSNESNAKQWAMLNDIANQAYLNNEKHDAESWKIILCSTYMRQKLIRGIDGEFIALNFRTSKATKSQMCDIIEIYYAFGTNAGVRWSEPALKEYEKYRQAS